jgi:hypothetical protein
VRALRSAAWPLLVVAAVLALLAPGLRPDRLLSWRDSLREFAPLRPIIAEALGQARLPLWDAYDGTGTPLFAQLLHGVLHPASVVLALLFPAAHLDALLVAYFLLAALGTYAAARALDAEPPAAAMAAAGYAGSGYVLGSAAFLTFLAGAASLPWLLAAGRRCGQGVRLGGATLALATAMTVLSGDLHAVVIGALLAAALALHAGGPRVLPRVAAGLATGALLAGVQLFPSWRFLHLTARSLTLSAAMQEQWALSPWRLPELVAPGLFGGRPGLDAPVVFQALEPGSQFPMPFAASVFVGSALLAAALAARRVRWAGPLLVATPVLLWLALGHRLGAQQLLQAVPIWGELRYAEKLVGPLTLVVALLGALGLPRLAELAPVRPVLLLAAAAGLLAGLCALPATGAWVLGAVLPGPAIPTARGQALGGLLQLALGLAALAILLAVARRAPRAFPPAFAALVLAQALLAVPFALPGSPVGAPLPPVPPAPPPGPRLFTPERRILPAGQPDAAAEGLRAEAALGFPGYNVAARVENVDVYGGLVSLRFEQVWSALDGLPAGWRRYGVTHVVLPAGPLGELGRRAAQGGALVGGSELVQVWAVPHRPWASFAPAVQAVAGPDRAQVALAAAIETERDVVIVEAAGPMPTSSGRILGVARGSEALNVEADATGPALLVIADAWWPGWVAELDGAPIDILPADLLLRAVRFPAGRHRLVMRYDPPEVREGLWLSGLGLVLLVVLGGWDLLAWRRGGRGGPDAPPSSGSAAAGREVLTIGPPPP